MKFCGEGLTSIEAHMEMIVHDCTQQTFAWQQKEQKSQEVPLLKNAYMGQRLVEMRIRVSTGKLVTKFVQTPFQEKKGMLCLPMLE